MQLDRLRSSPWLLGPPGRSHSAGRATSWPLTLLILGLAWGLASPAQAQSVAGLIQIDPLPIGDAGGCYPGTSGADSTAFLRLEPPGVGCDTGDSFNANICVGRREFGSDGPNGTPISYGDSALARPSVSADGAFLWFVRNLDLCVMGSDLDVTVPPFQRDREICFDLPDPFTSPQFYVNSATISPRGNELGMVPRDLNNISVPANAIQVFLARFPDLPLLQSYSFNQPLLFPETLDFMTNGDWIVFDASSTASLGGAWGIYLVRRSDGAVRTVIPPVAGFELRNPVFAQTSDDRIAFDAVEVATGIVSVLTANIVTAEVREIATINAAFGAPTFSGDDSTIVYGQNDAGVYSQLSLRSRALGPDGISPIGPEQPWLENAAFPFVYRRGAFDPTPTPCPEPALACGVGVAALALAALDSRRRSRRRGRLPWASAPRRSPSGQAGADCAYARSRASLFW